MDLVICFDEQKAPTYSRQVSLAVRFSRHHVVSTVLSRRYDAMEYYSSHDTHGCQSSVDYRHCGGKSFALYHVRVRLRET